LAKVNTSSSVVNNIPLAKSIVDSIPTLLPTWSWFVNQRTAYQPLSADFVILTGLATTNSLCFVLKDICYE